MKGTDVNMDFDIKNHAVLKLGSLELWITDTIVNTWIIMAVLIIFAVIVRIKLKKFSDVPKGLQNVVEMMVEAFDNFLRGTVGDRLMFLGNWFFTVFVFVLISNISGLFTLRPPTADWAFTVAIALVTFFLLQILAIRYRGRAYLKSFLEPFFLFLPLNLLGEIARPISLSFRLYGNILSGTIIMTLIYTITPIFIRFVIPAALHAYFDLFAGVLQTYIFCALSLSFISSAAISEAE